MKNKAATEVKKMKMIQAAPVVDQEVTVVQMIVAEGKRYQKLSCIVSDDSVNFN